MNKSGPLFLKHLTPTINTMILVLFEVTFHNNTKEQYQQIAASLKEQLEKTDGFIANERFQSLNDPGKLLSLSVWRDEKAVEAWRNQFDHRQGQAQGRASIFKDYRIRIAQVLRDYTLDNR